MHLSTLFGLGLLSALPFAQGAAHQHRRHTFQVRSPSNESETHTLEKRAFSNARFTFYDVGLGACGKYNVASDFIVALNTPQYGGGYPGPNCFKSITIQAEGKTTTATIMDQCPGCPYGGLDFSRGLFNFFASEDKGVITGTWWFNDGGDSAPAPAPEPPKTTKSPDPTTPAWTPTTSETPKWTPPTTSEEPKWTPTTTSTSEEKETPTSTHHSSSSSSAPPSTSSAPPSTSSAAPSTSSTPTSSASATPTPSQKSAIQAAEQALLGIVGLYVVGANNN